jgi:glycine/D-amino acid oxidase-like deaminating enzyme
MRVIIIGGGLGGLCLAQGLHRAGVRVTVYERDPTAAIRQQGYRIHIDSRGAGGLHRCLPERLYKLFLATSGRPGAPGHRAQRVTASVEHAGPSRWSGGLRRPAEPAGPEHLGQPADPA